MKKEPLENIVPIKEELRPILEQFLAYEPYQTLFMAFAKNLGYTGDDTREAKNSLFTIKEEQIGFNVLGMQDLFMEFQILTQISQQEPYKSLLSTYPQAITNIRELAKKILNKQPVTDKNLEELFKPENYESNGNS